MAVHRFVLVHSSERTTCLLEGRVPSRPAVVPTATLDEMNPSLPWQYTALCLCTLVNKSRVYWRAGFHPGQRWCRQRLWSRWAPAFHGNTPLCAYALKRTNHAFMEGRAPSRPAVVPTATLDEMNPGLPWQYTALCLCTQVNEPRIYWRAGFHPGQRWCRQQLWSRRNPAFHGNTPLCACALK